MTTNSTEYIPLCVPEIRGREWEYVKQCLDTGWVSSAGSYVDRFETDMARYVGTKRAIATVNGTAALHAALILCGVAPDDEVLVSTLTFIAPANAIRYVGARPVFMDVDPDYWQMDVGKVGDFLRRECRRTKEGLFNARTGRKVKGILPVHIVGHPVDLDPLLELATEFGLFVLEDATESLGAEYKGRRVGQFGAAACFSYNGNKLITTGGGGMITTNDQALADRAKYLTTQAKDDPIEYIHNEVGYNYRLTNVEAAIGCAQLEQIDGFIEAKRAIAKRYAAALSDIKGLTVMQQAPWAASVFWMYTALLTDTAAGCNSREMIRMLAKERIQARPLWQPLHLSPAQRGAQVYYGDVAERLARIAISLPCSVGLTLEQQERVIGAVRRLSTQRC